MIAAVSRFPPIPTAPAAASARPSKRPAEPPLTPDSPVIALAYRSLRHEYRSLLKRQPQHGATPTPEDVHQIRTATRRMRVTLRLFGSLLPPRTAARLGRDLRWFARALGTVRDLDVHAEALREHVRSLGPVAAQELGDYEVALQRERAVAHDSLREVVASDRYAGVMTAVSELLDHAPSPAALRRWGSFTIRAGAARYVKRSRKHVLKLGRELDSDAGSDDLHRLRKRAKQLRYTLEFFEEPYPALSPAARATKTLQDVLGAHQDARTARGRVLAYTRALRKRHGADAAPPDALRAWGSEQHQRAAQARREFVPEWQRFLAALDLTDVSLR